MICNHVKCFQETELEYTTDSSDNSTSTNTAITGDSTCQAAAAIQNATVFTDGSLREVSPEDNRTDETCKETTATATATETDRQAASGILFEAHGAHGEQFDGDVAFSSRILDCLAMKLDMLKKRRAALVKAKARMLRERARRKKAAAGR